MAGEVRLPWKYHSPLKFPTPTPTLQVWKSCLMILTTASFFAEVVRARSMFSYLRSPVLFARHKIATFLGCRPEAAAWGRGLCRPWCTSNLHGYPWAVWVSSTRGTGPRCWGSQGGVWKTGFFLEFAPAAALSKTGGFFNKIGFWGSLMGKPTQTRF